MTDIHDHVALAKKITYFLDNRFKVGSFSFGLDPLIGLVPIVGDLIPASISGYIIWIGYKVGMPTSSLLKMALYTILDFVIGEITIIGDIADFFYKSHTKNLNLLLKYLDSKNPSTPTRLK